MIHHKDAWQQQLHNRKPEQSMAHRELAYQLTDFLKLKATQHLVRADSGFAASGYASCASTVTSAQWSPASAAAAAQLGRWLAAKSGVR
jgi:hypothetical protein